MLIASHMLITPAKPAYRNETDFELVCIDNLTSIFKRARKNESIVLFAPKLGKLSLSSYLWLVENLASLHSQGREVIVVDSSSADIKTLALRKLITHVDDAKSHDWPFSIEKRNRKYVINGQPLEHALASPDSDGGLYRYDLDSGELRLLPLDREPALNTQSQTEVMSSLDDSLFIEKLKQASRDKKSISSSERISEMITLLDVDDNIKQYLSDLKSGISI